MSSGKRLRYENITSSSGEDTSEETVDNQIEVRTNNKYDNPPFTNNHFQNMMTENMSKHRPKSKPCSSKNALMARENRRRKKKYVSNLEDTVASLRRDNKKLTLIMDSQSSHITELKNEVKYLKSVIANSGDISRLIRNIHQSSGMSVSSSLDENLSLKNSYIPKPEQLAEHKSILINQSELSRSQSESSKYPYNSVSNDFGDELFENLDIPLDLPNQDLLNDVFFVPEDKTLSDHDYTVADVGSYSRDDVGVCLHVSKHHVSLEFCPSCSEKALNTWVS